MNNLDSEEHLWKTCISFACHSHFSGILEPSNLGAPLINLVTPLKPFNPLESSCLGMFKLHSPNCDSLKVSKAMMRSYFSTVIFSSLQLLIRTSAFRFLLLFVLTSVLCMVSLGKGIDKPRAYYNISTEN